MRSLSPAPPPAGVEQLLKRLQTRVSELIRQSTLDDADLLRSLPSEIRQTELPSVTRRNLAVILRSIAENVGPDDEDLQPAREIAVQRADEGVPLSLVIQNWQRGFRRLWDEVSAVAHADETAEVTYLGTALLALVGTYTTTLAEAYEQEQVVLGSEKSGAGHLVARMLLDGQDARPYADRFQIELVKQYSVLALEIESTPDELVDDTTGRLVAGRRKMRKILGLTDFRRTRSMISTLGPAGGHLLLPVDPDDASTPYDTACDLVDRIHSAVGVMLRAGLVECVDVAELPSAGVLSTEVLRLSAGHPSERTVYRLADVALAYQLSRPSAAREHLRGMLAAVEPFPELIEFLECYLRCDMDRGRTARALAVHPNTVNNRLHRLTSLTGVDPSGFEGCRHSAPP
ncbi:hypothetical protein GTV32_16180 [Gordonia sp. SID5947]|uniref:PucR family transcriptional regulator n=1 Tax=Gordonia sp. SID5947 TaxID=2690315 RepID=UPI00136CF9F2|nr:helix-turn-helix domain-containing protein [Gordonia sp. SID5947]MYR07743.1 hypothetical protein [Gordonia sp. SID5947]